MTSVRSPILSSPRKRSLRHRRGVWLLGEVCGCGMRHGFGGWAGHALKGGPVKGDVRGAVGFAFVGHNTREAEGQCLVVESFMAAYKDAIAMQGETAYINMEKAAQNEFLKSGYKYVKGYKRAATDDMDSVRLWVKEGVCVIAFQGSDFFLDFVNNWDPAPVDKWNLTQVHRGLIVELEPLLTMMQHQCHGDRPLPWWRPCSDVHHGAQQQRGSAEGRLHSRQPLHLRSHAGLCCGYEE